MPNSLKIYNASAGSGKTYTLVQEYLRIILLDKNKNKFSKILAMTFTNKAANEMKERVLQKLIQLSIDPSNRETNDQVEIVNFSKELGLDEHKLHAAAKTSLNAILHNYGMFAVMTLDKFTHKVIRTFARELGLSLDFDVELDLDTLRNNVADLLFDKIGRDEEITNLMRNYAESNLEDDKSWNFKQSLIEFSKQLFKEDAIEAIQLLSDYTTQQFIDAKSEIIKEREAFKASIRRLGKEALDIVANNGLTHDDFVAKSKGIISAFALMAKLDKVNPFTDAKVKSASEEVWGHKASPNKASADSLTPTLKNYFNQIEEKFEKEHPNYLLNVELLKLVNNLSLMNHLLKITEQLKEQDNVLLISDFYKKIAEIISNEPVPFIYERLGVRYEHFLLDEFQDTSLLQWVNLVPLLHNSLAQGHMNLIVGDGKQAIYRWRNGEVDQFMKLPDQIHNPSNIASLTEAQRTFKYEGETNYLTSNYRSAPEIVDFNNQFFNYLVQDKAEYIQDIYQHSGQQQAKKNHTGYLEFKFLGEKDKLLQYDYILDVVNKSSAVGYYHSDICILVTTNKTGSALAGHLSSAGIKVVSQDSLYVSKDLQVRFIFCLICSLSSPANKNYAKKCIEHFDKIFNHKSHLFNLIEEKVDIIDWMLGQNIELKPHEHYQSFYEYVEYLIIKFELDLEQNVYLQFFLEQVHEFEKRNNSNVHSFIDWFNDKGYKKSIQSPENSEAVNIMTIHKAKGLEFPIVICALFDWDISKNRSEKWITDSSAILPAFPLGVNNNTRGSIHGDLIKEEDLKHELDQLNLVYVSFTRAESALFVCGSISKKKGMMTQWVKPYLMKNEGMEDEQDICQIGEFTAPISKKELQISALEIDFCKPVMEKPKLSTKSGDQWDIHDLDKKREFGTHLHLLLSKLDNSSQIKDELRTLINKGVIGAEFEIELMKQASTLFTDPHFAAYFEVENVLNEKEIIDNDGEKHIPDKLIFIEDHVLIVDFKTGEELEKHHEQLAKYIALMKELGHKNVRAKSITQNQKKLVWLDL